MASNFEVIFKQFPTERYKRFWYPTRPLFTLFNGLFIASLGFIGLLPLSWALWFAAAFALDDLPLTPLMSMFTAVNNLMQGRKTLKAIVMITALTLAIIAGGLLGYFVLAHTPIAVKLITDYITLTSCSPIFISLGAMLGGLIAHATHKVSPFIGFVIGIILASLIPFSPPLIAEIVFLSIAACAFVTSVLVKQGLRAYYKFSYGHSNSDGYECARSPDDQAAFIKNQAAVLGVTPQELESLVTHCKDKISTNKRQATIWQEFIGERVVVTNSFKDIHHSLMNPKLTPEDAVDVKKLITTSQLATENNTQEIKDKVNVHFQLGTFFQHDDGIALRELGHQIMISEGGGLDAELVRPFY